jgi:hypothetical protein
MKKMLTLGAIAACASVFALESANIVGYNNTAARAGLNWYAPQFLTVGANTTDINAIQLDDGGAMSVGWGDNMQIVGPLGNPETTYLYLDPSLDPTATATTYFWADENYSAVDVTLQPGAGFAIDNPSELTFNIEIACPY